MNPSPFAESAGDGGRVSPATPNYGGQDTGVQELQELEGRSLGGQ